MNNIYKYFAAMIFALVAVGFFYSCAKELEKPNYNYDAIAETRGGGDDLIDLLGTSCVPNSINIGGGCNDTTFVDTVIVNTHAMYPGCYFKVVHTRQQCKENTLIDVTIGDFQIIDHNCPQFTTDAKNNQNQSIWSSYIIDFETGMWNSLRDLLIAENVTGNNFLCGKGVFFNINFVRASCYRYASVTRKDGIGICTKIACGTQCCERHTRIFRKPDGSLQIIQSDVTNPFTISCSGASILTNPPVKGDIAWMTPCMVSCPN